MTELPKQARDELRRLHEVLYGKKELWSQDHFSAYLVSLRDHLPALLDAADDRDRLLSETSDAGERVAQLEALGEKINAIRNSIIGLQKLNWSEHVYPLVAALNDAGFDGMEYPEARQNFGTMLERAVKAEDRADAAEAELSRLRAYADTEDAINRSLRERLDVAVKALEPFAIVGGGIHKSHHDNAHTDVEQRLSPDDERDWRAKYQGNPPRSISHAYDGQLRVRHWRAASGAISAIRDGQQAACPECGNDRGHHHALCGQQTEADHG